ncbi:Pleiotropic drug resistance 1 [Micractinium conductrix]|uniref:Pleiotropic drug resistance 1 n=1 Tax=Micractinium conductrix TaxID=554055 RepID=A0A2P6V5N8_9CHLO|nr:Pleiotropic drug resistance 1 [Micractinium conductrix]|eukprot:PSC69400.1 Pleiotropic drug resistance 1 [Micractinium conductrix]
MSSTRPYTDPFEVLGLPPSASNEEVKRAFRALALRCHPDVDRSPQAAARFTAIKRATDTILKGHHPAAPAGPGPASAYAAWQSYAQASAAEAPDWRPRSRHTALWLCAATLVGGFGILYGAILSHDWLGGYSWLTPAVAEERLRHPTPRRQQLMALMLEERSRDTQQQQQQQQGRAAAAAAAAEHSKQLAAKEAVLVKGPNGQWQLVTLRRLDQHARQLLLSRVYRESEDEGLGFFARVRDRLDRAGVPDATVEIRFKDLTVRGTQVVKPALGARSAWDKLKSMNPFHATAPKVRKWNIIDGVSGVIRPGRLTLLLGTPGSGRSVLMKALAGRLKNEKTLKALDRFVPERTAAYISQHYGELTVRQTLKFSARVQGGRKDLVELFEETEAKLGIKPDPDIHSYMAALAASGKTSLAVDIMLRTLGLEICADTLIGNHMIRGICGGQKKRVTGGEMLVGPSRMLFADEISTGLDSATTHDIVSAMRTVSHNMRSTQVVALLQPAPETYDLFDDIVLLSSGKIIFHGPRELVLPFFEEVPTLADQRRYWAGNPAEWQFVSADEIAHEFYNNTEPGRAAMAELSQPAPTAQITEDPALVKTRYGASLGELTRACLRRGLWLLGGNKEMHIGRLVQTILLAFVAGTLFLNEDKGLQPGPDGVLRSLTSANAFLGISFFSLTLFMVNAMPDGAMMVESLNVWYKHRFYPAFCFGLQAVMARVPWVFAEACVWTLMVYFMVGFTTSARLLAFWGMLFGAGVFSLTLFLACAAFMRRVPSTMALQATFLLLLFTTCGFVINKAQIPGVASTPLTTTPGWGCSLCGVGCSLFNFFGLNWLLACMPAPKDSVVVSEEVYAMQAHARTGSTSDLAALDKKSGGKLASMVKSASGGNLAGAAAGEAVVVAPVHAQQALPFKPLCITFRDICYSVPFPKGAVKDEAQSTSEGPHADRLVLLRNISGSFRPGVLTALMGASGAGKSTLMDVLAGRKTGGTITGDIRVNGHPKVHDTLARVMGYCEQNDIHMAMATVEEALLFSARLRLPSEVSKDGATTRVFVKEIMDLIELTPIAHSPVGIPGSGLNVEQRKRQTIAVELVANPSIVFMDEPTSGLDARGAGLVMRAVKATVDTGRIVVCTIHQPSLEIFEAFSELLLLKRGGEIIFNGPVGTDASNLINFSSINGVPAIKPRINPANWMLEVTSPDAEKATGLNFAELYNGSQLAEASIAMVEKYSEPPAGDAPLRYEDLEVSSWGQQMRELMRRNSRELLLFATLYANQGQATGTFSEVLNIAGAMFASSTFMSVMYLFIVQDVLVVRRTVFYREHAAGTYSVVPFWLAELLAEGPWLVASALIYSVIVYFSIGFINDGAKFFWYFLFMILSNVTLLSFGSMMVYLTPQLEISQGLSAFFFSLFNLIGGFMLPKVGIPAGWIWLYWLNPLSYVLYGLTASQLADVKTETVMPDGTSLPVDQFINSYFGFEHSFIGWAALVLAGFALSYRLVALFALAKDQSTKSAELAPAGGARRASTGATAALRRRSSCSSAEGGRPANVSSQPEPQH